jgi:abortive infection bacteriophage resistance protein
MIYNKPPQTIAGQIALLEKRGLKIANKKVAAHFLSNISYYRLSAYMKSFQKYGDPNHSFMPYATFGRIMDAYAFDRNLRLLLLDVIERVEVAFRCSFTYGYITRLGNNWYEDASHFKKGHSKSMAVIQSEISNSKEVFIAHYKKTYTCPANPPAFITFEILSFGQLSILYKNTNISDDKKAVGAHFGVNYSVLASWMEHLVYIRNSCAHHSRIWNRDFLINKPLIPRTTAFSWATISPGKPDKLYTTLIILIYLLKRINPAASFLGKLQSLLYRHPLIKTDMMGFPENWKEDDFWKQTYVPWDQKMSRNYFRLRSVVYKTSYWITNNNAKSLNVT